MKLSVLLLSAMVSFGAITEAQASTIFNFQFDEEGFVAGDGPVLAPVVGTGTFVSPIDLAPGTYDLTDPNLTGYTMSFTVNGDTYNQTNITTPITGVAVRIAAFGGRERLFFTESGGPGSDGGPQVGALDLSNGSHVLTFEPTYFGGNFLYQESSGEVGRYVAMSAVPEPATLTLTALGLAALLRRSHRRRTSR
jgi:hypothetical protein